MNKVSIKRQNFNSKKKRFVWKLSVRYKRKAILSSVWKILQNYIHNEMINMWMTQVLWVMTTQKRGFWNTFMSYNPLEWKLTSRTFTRCENLLHLVVPSSSSVCWWNQSVWPFLWKLRTSSCLWHCCLWQTKWL